MPEAARLGDTISTGHTPPCDTTSTILGNLQSTVYINGILGAVKGDLITPHTRNDDGCKPHLDAVVNVGSSTVFFEGIQAARKGDSADSDEIIEGSSTVNIGG